MKGNMGYKFAVTGNNVPCVVYLEIPDTASVVFDHHHNKYRCNLCIVKDIKPIKSIIFIFFRHIFYRVVGNFC